MRSYVSHKPLKTRTRTLPFISISILFALFWCSQTAGQKRRIPTGGRPAIVVDERLAALRAAPSLTARLDQRLARGRYVAIMGKQRSIDGITFYQVKVTRRRHGWIQSDSLVTPLQPADDQRLLRLIRGSEDFDLVARARIFLDTFPQSPLRAPVLLLFGDAVEEACSRLARDAGRRLSKGEMSAGGAPEFSYFMNFNELDRYNRQGVRFVFDSATRQFHYDGAAWRELLRRYPQSPEAVEARKRLGTRPTPSAAGR
jgi:hypothetical protein